MSGQYDHLNPAPCNNIKTPQETLSSNQTQEAFLLTLSPPIETAASRDRGISVVLPRVQVGLMRILPALLLGVNSEMAGSTSWQV